MVLLAGKEHTFISPFGRRFEGKTVQYRLLDKDLTEITSYSATGIVDLTAGRYGIILTISNVSVKFIQFKDVDDDFYVVLPITIPNVLQEQSFIANFGKRRTGKTVRFRILDKDKNEISTWTTTGVVELGAGSYGVVTVINSDAQKYIQYWNVEDSLYLTDPINRALITGPEYSATSYKSGIVSHRFGVHIQSPALNYGLKKHRLGCNIRSPQIKARVNNNPEVRI